MRGPSYSQLVKHRIEVKLQGVCAVKVDVPQIEQYSQLQIELQIMP